KLAFDATVKAVGGDSRGADDTEPNPSSFDRVLGWVLKAATEKAEAVEEGAQKGQAALDLISKHKNTIISAARARGVNPQHVASIIFQEKYHGNWASLKNGPAWVMITAGANDASVGLAEMDINTAARLLDVDVSMMSRATRNQIIKLLANDQSAISLIALNVASFQTRLGRPVTLQEATYGHNAGIDALARDLPINQGSPIARRSWGHQGAISDALR
ncbi:hypothetical protein, partial [Exilibacterium tricleocarpae]|uniref:hypothetical protein n=1 Tax=Exilibacterium tricleocarpae TaxID=2591008 RepID=UPI0015D194CD